MQRLGPQLEATLEAAAPQWGRGSQYFRIDGSVSAKERYESVRRFNEGGAHVFLIR